jgi:hypothetical protein
MRQADAALGAALPLAPGTDRQALRLLLPGALNWAQVGYRPDGGSSPAPPARQFVLLLQPQDPARHPGEGEAAGRYHLTRSPDA